MTQKPYGDVDPVEFSQAAHEAVDWITSYLENNDNKAVRSKVAPGDVAARIAASPPTGATPLSEVVSDIQQTILPGITHWNHPAFFAYFANTGSYPGILGELITAALNVNGMLWATSPAATELEQVTLDWLRQSIGLKQTWFGEITDTASVSTFYALAAARERADPEAHTAGMYGRTHMPVLRVYCSEHAHSSIDKAAIALGIGQNNIIKVACDDQFRMDTSALAHAMDLDKAAGFRAMAVVATVGTTSTTSIDPVLDIVRIAKEYNCWVHVDGAYGGSAAIVPELRYMLDGTDDADSFVINPHKWLFTPMDCSALYVRDPALLRRTFALQPEYLTTRHNDDVVNLMDYGIQLGRRFRALKLWMVMRSYGTDGLAERIRFHCELAREFAGMVYYEGGWEIMAPVTLSTVCFRFAPEGESEESIAHINAAILEHVNDSGVAFLSHTRLNGKYTLRLAVGNIRTERKHINRAWDALRVAAKSCTSLPSV